MYHYRVIILFYFHFLLFLPQANPISRFVGIGRLKQKWNFRMRRIPMPF